MYKRQVQAFDGASREEVEEEVPPTPGVEELSKVQKVEHQQVEVGKGKSNVTLEPRDPQGPTAKKAKKAKLPPGGVTGQDNELRQATSFPSPTILPMPCPSQTVIFFLCHSPIRRLSFAGGKTPPGPRGAKEASPFKKPRLTAKALAKAQETNAWEAEVDKFVELAGVYHLVAGDGSCWMWSMLCAMGVLQHGNEINFREKNKRAKKACSCLLYTSDAADE